MKKPTITQPVNIDRYTGYHHNRYDGYISSWGVLMALGASPTADCFADDNDYPDENFNISFQELNPDCDNFRELVLSNLDITIEDFNEIKELEIGEQFEHKEWWGEYGIPIIFKKMESGEITCIFDNYGPFTIKI
jgi:hypothetical protein